MTPRNDAPFFLLWMSMGLFLLLLMIVCAP